MSKAILELYKKARIKAPNGKGIHTLKYHKCIINVMLKIKAGKMPADSNPYSICMSSIGRDEAVKKGHQR